MGARGGFRFLSISWVMILFVVWLGVVGFACDKSGTNASSRPATSAVDTVGPLLSALPPDQGLLTVDFPDRVEGGIVRVVVFGQSSPGYLKNYPAQLVLPLNAKGVVRFQHEDYRPSDDSFVLTPENRHIHINIRPVENPRFGDFGLGVSKLPSHTGLQLIKPAEPGRPVGKVFMYDETFLSVQISSVGWFVDEHGDVWDFKGNQRATSIRPSQCSRVGRIGSAKLAEMKALGAHGDKDDYRSETPPAMPIPIGWGDATATITVFRQSEYGPSSYILAEENERARLVRPSAQAQTLIAWMVAVHRQLNKAGRK